jgi:hypothetical protein
MPYFIEKSQQIKAGFLLSIIYSSSLPVKINFFPPLPDFYSTYNTAELFFGAFSFLDKNHPAKAIPASTT